MDKALVEELLDARDRIYELEELLGLIQSPDNDLLLLKMPRQQAQILGILMKARSICTRDHIFTVMFGNRNERDQPVDRIIDTQICKLRGVLRQYGITIHTVWAQGWYMTQDDKNKVLAVIESLK